MSQYNLDDHLAVLSKQQPDNGKLLNLESDVWIRIHAYDRRWQQMLISAFNSPQLQISAITLALLFGISLGSLFPIELKLQSEKNIIALDMKIFSTNNPYLTANLIEKIK